MNVWYISIVHLTDLSLRNSLLHTPQFRLETKTGLSNRTTTEHSPKTDDKLYDSKLIKVFHAIRIFMRYFEDLQSHRSKHRWKIKHCWLRSFADSLHTWSDERKKKTWVGNKDLERFWPWSRLTSSTTSNHLITNERFISKCINLTLAVAPFPLLHKVSLLFLDKEEKTNKSNKAYEKLVSMTYSINLKMNILANHITENRHTKTEDCFQ